MSQVYACVCIHIHMYTHIYIYTHIQIDICAEMCIHIFIHISLSRMLQAWPFALILLRSLHLDAPEFEIVVLVSSQPSEFGLRV